MVPGLIIAEKVNLTETERGGGVARDSITNALRRIFMPYRENLWEIRVSDFILRLFHLSPFARRADCGKERPSNGRFKFDPMRQASSRFIADYIKREKADDNRYV